jgi:hypothetical protein
MTRRRIWFTVLNSPNADVGVTKPPPWVSSVCIDHSQYSSLWGCLRLPWSLYTKYSLNTHSVWRRKTSLLLSLSAYSKWLPTWRVRSIKFVFPTKDNTWSFETNFIIPFVRMSCFVTSSSNKNAIYFVRFQVIQYYNKQRFGPLWVV